MIAGNRYDPRMYAEIPRAFHGLRTELLGQQYPGYSPPVLLSARASCPSPMAAGRARAGNHVQNESSSAGERKLGARRLDPMDAMAEGLATALECYEDKMGSQLMSLAKQQSALLVQLDAARQVCFMLDLATNITSSTLWTY